MFPIFPKETWSPHYNFKRRRFFNVYRFNVWNKTTTKTTVFKTVAKLQNNWSWHFSTCYTWLRNHLLSHDNCVLSTISISVLFLFPIVVQQKWIHRWDEKQMKNRVMLRQTRVNVNVSLSLSLYFFTSIQYSCAAVLNTCCSIDIAHEHRTTFSTKYESIIV